MRDLLLVGIILGALPFALRHTWVAVMLWTWISIMNPHRLAFGFASTLPVAAVAAGAALLSLVFTRDKLRMPWSPPVIVLVLFVVWMCLTTAFAINPLGSWDQLNKVLKIQLMTAVALMALHERKHIELFIWVNVLSVGYYSFKGGLFTITTGGEYRVWGPEDSFFWDNNALAVATIMVIPMMYYLRVVSTHRWVRFGLLMLMLLSAVSALGSQSRGALLAITAMGSVFWYRSNRKGLVGIVVVAVAIGLISFMPDSWSNRMATITTYEEDNSAKDRLIAWQFCFNLANHRLSGGGYEIYNALTYTLYAPETWRNAFAAHSIYFSVLGEHGYVGLVLFLLIWGLTFRLAGKLRRETRGQPGVAWVFHLTGMFQVSLVGYLAGGAFLSLAYFDLPYNIMVILVVTQRWLRESGWKPAAVGALGSASAGKPSDLPVKASRAPV
ncbi:putative O-glycosylation ligase, exosortase A system-associated [Accumulibacter sp.]|uniref:putative O-glycosylation ligase, exosortase A system-associated n=1 Tax=Accumulibacter sp. TaxID=2053492 RepID=UPI00260B8B65|nr:putative O-glycosylation ligase, exosortase A system-associated [Accumulibacter sp.]